MKIFKWIRGYFEKVRSRFRNKKQEQDIRDRIVKTKGTTQEEIKTRINEKVNQDEPLSQIEIEELVATQTATELQALVNTPTKTRKRVFDLVEIEQEVSELNRKLIDIQVKQRQVEPIRFPQNYSTDKGIEELERILQKHDNKQNLTLSTSAIDKLKSRFGQFDKFLQERILVKIYRIREEKQKREEETKKQQVKELIGRVENLINQGSLQDMQSLISKATSSISGLRNPDQKKSFREKLETLKAKFRESQVREEAKRQAEELKRQQEEAERISLAEEARREEEKQRREQAALIQRQQDEAKRKKEEEKKQELQRLLARKPNWQEYADVLQEYGVTTFYHFTDRANIASIKKNGGLFSWQYCDRNGISIPVAGGDTLSRKLDIGQGLQDFVRLSFISDHPMMHVALRDRRIFQSAVLKISLEVAYLENTKFSNMNAADNRHQNDTSVSFLKNLRFDLFKQSYFNLEGTDKKYFQSEVMVKTWIPIEYITNINQF